MSKKRGRKETKKDKKRKKDGREMDLAGDFNFFFVCQVQEFEECVEKVRNLSCNDLFKNATKVSDIYVHTHKHTQIGSF